VNEHDEAIRLRRLILRAPRTGLYIHLPYCNALCPYCDFAVVVGRSETRAPYLDALVREARARREEAGWDALHTLFIGGGTPSVIDADALARLLDQTREIFGWRDDIEISIEANPESVTGVAMKTLAAAGVNRVSIGAQSFDTAVLRALGREHDAAATERAVDAVRDAGIARINLDLIYGTPIETDSSWAATLEGALALRPEHLSTYALTIEERTRFGTLVAAGEMPDVDEDAIVDRFRLAIEACAAAGLRQYELSNFARPGAECRHNLGIWCGGDYLGLGIGAHSLRANRRWHNARDLTGYLADPGRALAGEEVLDATAAATEWLSVRIRLRAGFPEAVAQALLPGLSARAEPLINAGLLERIDGYLRTTVAGMLLDNEVTLRLLSTR
jgi:oxygen-independent coproporphyrinogen-3 oxidase